MDTGKQSEIARVNFGLEAMNEDAHNYNESHADDHINEMKEIHEIENEFKVFRDPTFNDFVKIFGKTYNPDLPLFT